MGLCILFYFVIDFKILCLRDMGPLDPLIPRLLLKLWLPGASRILCRGFLPSGRNNSASGPHTSGWRCVTRGDTTIKTPVSISTLLWGSTAGSVTHRSKIGTGGYKRSDSLMTLWRKGQEFLRSRRRESCRRRTRGRAR